MGSWDCLDEGSLTDERELRVTGSIIPRLEGGHPDIATVLVVPSIVGFTWNPEPTK